MSEKINLLDDFSMENFEKITSWFQVVASALFVLFSLFNIVRTFVQNSDCFYALCFAAMLYLSWWLLRISVRELLEIIRKGGKE